MLQNLSHCVAPNYQLTAGSPDVSNGLIETIKCIVSIINGQDPSIGGKKKFQMHRYMINLLLATQENFFEGERLDSDSITYFTISRLEKISKDIGKNFIEPIQYDRHRVATKVYKQCKHRGFVRIKRKNGAQWVGVTAAGEQGTMKLIDNLILQLPKERRPSPDQLSKFTIRKTTTSSLPLNEIAKKLEELVDELKETSSLYTSRITDEYYENKMYRKAIEKLDEGLRLNPLDPVAYYMKGSALMKFGRYEEAVECFDRASEIDPSLAFVWMNRGNALDDWENIQKLSSHIVKR